MSDTTFYTTTVPRADTDFTVPKRYSELKMIGRGAQVCGFILIFYWGFFTEFVLFVGK